MGKVENTTPEIVCLVEINWREGNKGKQPRGYKRYWNCRNIISKKGRGLAIFVKKNIISYGLEN